MHRQAATGRRVCIVVVVLVEAIPPVEVVLGERRLVGLAGCRPIPGHQEVALHRSHRAVRPASPALLVLDGSDVVLAIYVAQVEVAWRVRLADRHERDARGNGSKTAGYLA